ncbi:hypothetical protein FEM48_Zijuj10G0059600 [Ziziphus jujuba var. spinosa]|uniref:Serine carboxypeptidase-like 45 n=1 Tax=Ziziphus jujuba var. spinosa TaxID=714518 RepID=A0A978ULQ0_ZIZJJ|nr:hypothetical protein FEM48_Zijuj10G0059600 [Ziziphus jujuba var. spinosa]
MVPFPCKPWIKMAVMIFVIFIQTNLIVESQPKSDKIISLPGQPDHVSFQQFSGYVMVDEKQHRALFYYFVEAEEHPASSPLVLWLAGGPGCSSAGAGAFMEHGPFRPNGENLVKNEYSHYVPQLAQLVLHPNLRLSLRGVAIGNPLLAFITDFNSQAGYFWSHGLISDSSYKLVKRVCNISRLRREHLLGGPVSESCRRVNHVLSKEITEDLDRNDSIISTGKMSKTHFMLVWLESLNGACASTIAKGSLVKSGIRIMVYSGDQDSVIPFTGTRSLVSRLAKELKLKTTQPYRAWIEGKQLFDLIEPKQVGGWSQVYGNDNMLSFAIIRGGSHTTSYKMTRKSN